MTADYQLPVAELDPVGLSELEGTAALQTRRDRKYLVPLAQLETILEQAKLTVLEIDGKRTFRYESVYFDTPDRISYLAAAHRRRRRFKVRTRSYVDSRVCLLEVKTRERRGLTNKHRIRYEFDERRRLGTDARQFISGFDSIEPVIDRLEHSLTTQYRRTTMLEAGTSSRITIDTDLVCLNPAGLATTLPGTAIVETKTDGTPCGFDHLLWAAHHRPTKISKYGVGLAVLTPGLPANKWNRVLRRHFGWSPRRTAQPVTASGSSHTRTVS